MTKPLKVIIYVDNKDADQPAHLGRKSDKLFCHLPPKLYNIYRQPKFIDYSPCDIF